MRSSVHFPRGYLFDDDFDRILEEQRAEDGKPPMESPALKRKREVLSDQDYRLRKDRTEGLVEGLRDVYERSLSPTEKSRLESKHKEKREGQGEQPLPDKKVRTRPVSDGLEPPPAYRFGDDPEDPDSGGEVAVGIAGDEGNGSDEEDDERGSNLQERTEDSPGKGEAATDGSAGVELLSVVLGEQAVVAGRDMNRPTRVVLTIRQFRRVMAAKESLFKFGTFVPKSEREAELSPEAPRWRAGRDLEWMRLRDQGTFERD